MMRFSNRFVALLILIGLSIGIIQCAPSEPEPDSPKVDAGVTLELDQLPYGKLSEYHFFTGALHLQIPNDKVLPYDLNSALFTDYALKNRFVYMPAGTKAEYVTDDQVLDFPVGTALIKTFYYKNVVPNSATKILETRVMVKKDNAWLFAEYVWNEEQTEAYLQMDGSNVAISWYNENNTILKTNYRIPSETECLTCHKQEEKPIPIGPKPQNLNRSMQYPEGSFSQLQKWVDEGYLTANLPSTILSTVDYSDATQPLAKRIRSYLDINCAHCHQEGSHCDYRPLRLAFSETDEDANLGICVLPDESIGATYKYLVWPTRADNSVMHYRLATTEAQTRMPLLGRTIVHEEGVALLKEWINNLDPCN